MRKHHHNFHLFMSIFGLIIASYLASRPLARLPAGVHSQISVQAETASDTQTSGRRLPLCLQTPSPGSSDPSAGASGHAELAIASADGVFPLCWLAGRCQVLMTSRFYPVHPDHGADSEL